MERLANQYLKDRTAETVIDIGSQDVNGSYRSIFESRGWKYIGLDSEPGKNVDMVIKNPYSYPIKNGTIDLVISGQAFEHIEYFWLSWLEIVRVTKINGLIFLIAPSRGSEHRYPTDCWRFYPDGYRALATWGGLQLLQVSTDWQPHSDPGSAEWGDTVGVFHKQKSQIKRKLLSALITACARHLF
jgi:SAM-dependent methyltransferase